MKLAYAGVLLGAFVIAITASWTALGRQIDNDAYDFYFRIYRPSAWETSSIILAIDDDSLSAFGGIAGMRKALATALDRIRPAHPQAVAIDVILAEGAQDDEALENAFRQTPNLVLSCDLLNGGRAWDDPIPRFRRWAADVGQVHADLDKYDGISRDIPLAKAAGNDRRWALSLAAFRVSRHARIVETPEDVQVAGVVIPAPSPDRTLRIRYVPLTMPGIPRVTLKELRDDPRLAARFAGKVVFAGATAQTLVRDRWLTPYSNGNSMPGIEIHANAFETIAQRLFITDVPAYFVLAVCLLWVALAGAAYAQLTGWAANIAALLIVLASLVLPYVMFTRRLVFPFLPGVAAASLGIISAAAWRHFVVRRRLGKSEIERARYQQAMHFVTHEMRTPLTAIQGSSELISRYTLPEEKRKEIADLINSESKRLARMIEMFLNVERLSAGQLELKRERFSGAELMHKCIERVRPLADRKQIAVSANGLPADELTGDCELMEYAFYNLLTNAVKYSPPQTRVTVTGERQKERLSFSILDQGIGIDQKEVRRIFEKFYRTKKAEQSGETGTGIGLSIVEQIVVQHGGSILVDSTPGKGSCFTLVLPLE